MAAMGNGRLVMGQHLLYYTPGTFDHLLCCNLEQVLGVGKSTVSSTKNSSLLVLARKASTFEGGNDVGAAVVGRPALSYLVDILGSW